VVAMEDFKLQKKNLNANQNKQHNKLVGLNYMVSDVQKCYKKRGIKKWLHRAESRKKWIRITRRTKVELKGPKCHKK
jgi:hypothetical protein